MFVNAYEFSLTAADGREIPVALRLTTAQQMKLKERWKEGTSATLFAAADDIERFADVMTRSLDFKDNTNEIKKGTELIDLMAMNDMLGLVERQKILSTLGRVSGIFSEKDKARIDASAEAAMADVFDGEGADPNINLGKNM